MSSLPPQDIYNHCTDEGITMVTDIPYFEGDFWPNIIEEIIKELDQEARQREASELACSEVSLLHTVGVASVSDMCFTCAVCLHLPSPGSQESR